MPPISRDLQAVWVGQEIAEGISSLPSGGVLSTTFYSYRGSEERGFTRS